MVDECADVGMAAEDGGGAGFARAAFAAVVECGGWEVVAEIGCEVGSGAGDEGSVAVVSLVPEVAVADDAGGAEVFSPFDAALDFFLSFPADLWPVFLVIMSVFYSSHGEQPVKM